MKKLLEFILAFSSGASFCFALGLDPLAISIAGLGASLFNQYRKKYANELSVWLVMFLFGVLYGFRWVTAIAAGPVAVLIVRLFQDGITVFGFSLRFPRISGERWTAVILAGGWFCCGMISRVDAVFVLIGTRPFVLDPAGFLYPLSVLLPVSIILFLPLPKTSQSVSSSDAETLDFSNLSTMWLNEPSTGEILALDDDTEKEPSENKCSTDVDFNPTGPYSSYLKAFWSKYVTPYRKIFEEFDLIETIKRILVILDRHGGVPSVRMQDEKDKRRESNQYEALAKIPLVVHTLHVAENVVETINERFPENVSQHLPGLFVAALAHDLGKLEIISGKKYVTSQHPVSGANFLQEEVMTGHPWCEKIAEFVRRHHEAIVDRTPVDLAILIRADRKARAMELNQKVHLDDMQIASEKTTETNSQSESDYGNKKTFPPEVKEIPSSFPIDKIFERLIDVTNVMLPNRSWVAFSQPDGVVYIQAETLHETISRIAQEEGLEDAFFHATDKDTKKSCLQSFYEEFRKRGWVPENLVGAGYYGNFFWVWNPVSRRKVRTFYVPVKAEAFRLEPIDLEAQRKAHAILASVKVISVATPEKR